MSGGKSASDLSLSGRENNSILSPSSDQGKPLRVPSLRQQQEDSLPGIGNSRDAQLTSSTLARTDSELTSFMENIQIYNGSKIVTAVALIDTLCEADICISHRLVTRLGKADEVSKDDYSSKKRLESADEGEIEICGSVTLEWKILDGHTVHENKFLVLGPRTFDVIIGKEKIVAEKLVIYDRSVLKPMFAHNKIALGEKAKMALLIEGQRQEKAALESQRLNSEKGKQQRSAQSG